MEDDMMNDFSDVELRDSYRSRNKSMADCLDFFTKFLAKLDYYLDKIEDLDETLPASEEVADSGEVTDEYKRSVRSSKVSAKF